jgi:N-acetylmuramoyl-L-alanine amidase
MKSICKIFLLSIGMVITGNLNAQKLRTIVIDAGHGYKGPNKTSPDGAPGTICNEDDVALGVALKLGDMVKKKYPALKIIQTRLDEQFVTLKHRSTTANNNDGDLFISIHVNDTETRWEKVVDSFRIETKFKTETDTAGNKVQVPYEVQIPVYKRQRVGCSAFGSQIYVMNSRNTPAKIEAEINKLLKKGDTSKADILLTQSALNVKKNFLRSTRLSELIGAEFDGMGRLFNKDKSSYQRPKGIHVLEGTSMPSVLVETGFICNDGDEEYLCSDKGQQELAEAVLRAIVKYKERLEKGSGANVENDAKIPPTEDTTLLTGKKK